MSLDRSDAFKLLSSSAVSIKVAELYFEPDTVPPPLLSSVLNIWLIWPPASQGTLSHSLVHSQDFIFEL